MSGADRMRGFLETAVVSSARAVPRGGSCRGLTRYSADKL